VVVEIGKRGNSIHTMKKVVYRYHQQCL